MVEHEPVIGTEREPPKVYTAGRYLMTQRTAGEYTLAEQDRVFAILKMFGFTDPQQLNNQTIVMYFDWLDKEGKIREALDFLLEFKDTGLLHRWRRILRMTLFRETKQAVIEQMKRDEAARAIRDFFTQNFGSMRRSGHLRTHMALS